MWAQPDENTRKNSFLNYKSQLLLVVNSSLLIIVRRAQTGLWRQCVTHPENVYLGTLQITGTKSNFGISIAL